MCMHATSSEATEDTLEWLEADKIVFESATDPRPSQPTTPSRRDRPGVPEWVPARVAGVWPRPYGWCGDVEILRWAVLVTAPQWRVLIATGYSPRAMAGRVQKGRDRRRLSSATETPSPERVMYVMSIHVV